MAIAEYRKKRNFERTPEPRGESSGSQGHHFVVQEHHASRLHFDLRLEMDGVLKSWAVPKGPSLDPSDKRLAVRTEDHPIEYMSFEGRIPEGNYGAGDVAVWDAGLYEVRGEGDAENQLAKSHLKLVFYGEKLKGAFALVRMDRAEKEEWLLIKDHDDWAEEGWRLQPVLTAGKGRKKRDAANVEGAKNAPMPSSVKPMLATLVDEPFSDDDWLFEVKWDGYRALCFVEDGNARLVSRNGQDLSGRFGKLSSVSGWLDADSALLDGELVALDDEGISRFQLLQPKWGGNGVSLATEESRRIVYYAFDLLYYNGEAFSVPR